MFAKKWIIIGVLLVLTLGILFAWPKITSKKKNNGVGSNADEKINQRIENAGLECIDHIDLVSHIHPELEIYVDNEKQVIPANIGISYSCMAEIHTHDTTGKIHVESGRPGRTFALQQFFDVWGRPVQRADYELVMTVNGRPSEELDNLILKDEDKIRLDYTKLPEN